MNRMNYLFDVVDRAGQLLPAQRGAHGEAGGGGDRQDRLLPAGRPHHRSAHTHRHHTD